jgi:hypothetical protein
LQKLLSVLAALAAVCVLASQSIADESSSITGPIGKVVPSTLLANALAARERFMDRVQVARYVTIIDYSRPSGERRMYVVDLDQGTAEAMFVAHGRGSDPENDGVAHQFSDVMDSKMTSLGAFVTGETYDGHFGRALRLHGLEASNASAFERAIVMHGAPYVGPGLRIMGRSWGCPAIDERIAPRIISELANGSFIYAVGPSTPERRPATVTASAAGLATTLQR